MTLEEVTAAGAIVGAVGSTIAAIVGVVTLIGGARRRHREKTEADEAKWTFRLYEPMPEGERIATIDYDMRRPLQMRSLRVINPRGAKIQYYETVMLRGRVQTPGESSIRQVGKAAAFLECSRLLQGSAHDAGTIPLLVYIPERPLWSRSVSTRLRIEVKAEATTAGRRQSTIIVTSDETPWTAKQTASTR